MYDYDMVVIGSGPSGRRAAVQFAKRVLTQQDSTARRAD
jgi:pyruvate/2-oxoglutarate dehydrogenase complex dihydrolipoamide dehydrogenase (E3) component